MLHFLCYLFHSWDVCTKKGVRTKNDEVVKCWSEEHRRFVKQQETCLLMNVTFKVNCGEKSLNFSRNFVPFGHLQAKFAPLFVRNGFFMLSEEKIDKKRQIEKGKTNTNSGAELLSTPSGRRQLVAIPAASNNSGFNSISYFFIFYFLWTFNLFIRWDLGPCLVGLGTGVMINKDGWRHSQKHPGYAEGIGLWQTCGWLALFPQPFKEVLGIRVFLFFFWLKRKIRGWHLNHYILEFLVAICRRWNSFGGCLRTTEGFKELAHGVTIRPMLRLNYVYEHKFHKFP